MTTSFPPISPKLQKGSIIAIDMVRQKQVKIEFQYNPDTLTRRLTAQTASGNYDRSEAFRLKGPPEETISLEIEIDATDELESGDSKTTKEGIYPRLAALELLLYPTSKSVIDNNKLAQQGWIEVIPPEAPLTLFTWGTDRTLPVRLTSFSITEEAFDPKLNPIRAKVSLDMMVLNYHDLGYDTYGGKVFLKYHQQREKMAGNNTLANK